MNRKSGDRGNARFQKDLSPLPKTDVRYWQGAIFKQGYTERGQPRLQTTWSVRIQHEGHRDQFNLRTTNKAEAAARAKALYLFLQAHGWEATLAKYKGMPLATKKVDVTIGEFLAELRAKSDMKAKTLEGYAMALRKIVADITRQPHGRSGRHDIHEAWRAKIEMVKVSSLTAAKIQKWKVDFVRRAGTDPAKQRVARISANTFLRRAKSLFSPKLMKYLEATVMPDPLPFEGVDFYKRSSMRYHSSFDVFKLIETAQEELAQKEPEQFKIFLLAVMAGLRRREIDTLEWGAFRWDLGVIRIEPTPWFHAKSEDSIGDVEIDAELIAIFRAYHAKATSSFVIESEVAPRPEATWEHYRCTSVFENLVTWLRSKGVDSTTPLHTLRKEFGSRIAAEHGIYAASRLLRHADIATTAQHYLDKKKRVTSGFGHVLKHPPQNGV